MGLMDRIKKVTGTNDAYDEAYDDDYYGGFDGYNEGEDDSDMQMAAGMPASVRPLEGEVREGEIVPRFTDLDVNMHVNNTKYMDWCCNALDLDIMKDHCIMSFDVNYDAEILPGCRVHTELTMKEDAFAFLGFVEGRRSFGISGKLMHRKDEQA